MADSVEPERKRLKPDFDTTIKVLVGADEVPFTVHQAAITAKPPFFAAACGREWKEGQQKLVRLAEQDGEVFTVYLYWVYAEKLDMGLMREPPGQVLKPSWLNLAKVWELGNYLQDFGFCNTVIDRMIERHQAVRAQITTRTLEYIWQHTAPDAALRRLILAVVAARANRTYIEEDGKNLPLEIVLDLAERFAGGEVRSVLTMADRCKYHLHGDEIEKCE